MDSRLSTTIVICIAGLLIGAPLIAIVVTAFIYFRYHIPLHELIPAVLLIVDPLLIIVVLIETIALVFHSFSTHKANQATAEAVRAIGASVTLLERNKVYLRLVETTQNAKRYIHHLSFAQSTSTTGDDEERKRVGQFLDALGAACRNLPRGQSSRADVKILGPDWPEKIGGLWERQLAGCEVRVSAEVSNYDVRIQVIDDRTIVLGVGPLSRESERGFLIESYLLADVLNDRFMKLWTDEFTKPLEPHTIRIVMSQVKATLPKGELEEIITNYLHVPTQEITNKILTLLERTEHLTGFDGVFYKNELIRELHGQDLSDNDLRTCLLDMGTGMSDSTIANFIKLVRGVDAVGYTKVQPSKGGTSTSESESHKDSPRDEPPEKN